MFPVHPIDGTRTSTYLILLRSETTKPDSAAICTQTNAGEKMELDQDCETSC